MSEEFDLKIPELSESTLQAVSLLDANRRIAALEADLERERMRLVACCVVALADTPDSAKSAREMHPEYRSAALSDVERRVDECIQLRAELAKVREELAISKSFEHAQAGLHAGYMETLKAERDALLLIKEAADVLYSEAEEFDLPDGLGMGASQQYWDDLANALFPDDGGKVIQADLRKAQAEIDSAIKAFETEIAKPDVLPCGHPTSMLLKSAETGDPLYCEYCDCIQRRNDAEKMERDLKLEIYNLKADKSQTLMEAERAMAQIREVNLKMWAERDALRKAWECAKRQNAHDMLLSGDEIHQHDAAIQQARGAK